MSNVCSNCGKMEVGKVLLSKKEAIVYSGTSLKVYLCGECYKDFVEELKFQGEYYLNKKSLEGKECEQKKK